MSSKFLDPVEGTPEVGPCLRLVVCRTCKTTEEIPDWDKPSDDPFLDDMGERHRLRDGSQSYHNGLTLYRVEIKHWTQEVTKRQIMDEIWGTHTGFDPEYYATKNTYYEDALKCFSAHHRPKGGCIDWRNEEKRIGNPTEWGRQQGTKVYLCDFCPVKSQVMTQIRHKKGMYK